MTNKPTDTPRSIQIIPSIDSNSPKTYGQREEEAEKQSLNRRMRSKVQAVQQSLAHNSMTVVRLFQILLLLLAIHAAAWIWRAWRKQQVKTTEVIGTLQGMTVGSGWRGASVIEVRSTPGGFGHLALSCASTSRKP